MILNLGLQAGYLRQNYSAEKKKCFKFNKCPSHTPRSIPDYAGRKEKERRKERERERARNGGEAKVRQCVLARLFQSGARPLGRPVLAQRGANNGSAVIVGRKRVLTHDRPPGRMRGRTGHSVVTEAGQNRGTRRESERALPRGARKW